MKRALLQHGVTLATMLAVGVAATWVVEQTGAAARIASLPWWVHVLVGSITVGIMLLIIGWGVAGGFPRRIGTGR